MFRPVVAQAVNNARSSVFTQARFLASRASSSSIGKRIHHHQSGHIPPSAVENAVTHILHHTTIPLAENRHVFNCLVEKGSDTMNRVSGTIASRGYKIESLVVASTEVQDLSRITIVLNGTSVQIEQVRRQLEDLVPVWAVLDYTKTQLVERELLLIKVSLLGPESLLHEPSLNTRLDEKNIDMNKDNEAEEEFRHENDMMRWTRYFATPTDTFSHLRSLSELTRLFGGKIIDVSSDSIMVELCGKSSRLSSFIKLCKPFGILEASRSGRPFIVNERRWSTDIIIRCDGYA